MELNKIEQIHERYEEFMDDYRLKGSYSVWIPFFKVTLQMNYLYETELTMTEDFVCKCIERGITTKSKIMFVLALDEEIFDMVIVPLLDSDYLEERGEDSQIFYRFTELGKKLIEKRTRFEPKTMMTDWYYDGLGDKYKLDFFSTSHEHKFRKIEEISKKENQLIITPIVLPKYEADLHFQLLARQTIEKIDETNQAEQEHITSKSIVNIEHFELLTDRKIYYHEYRVLAFQNEENEYKLIAHDPCGKDFVDQQVTESIMKLAEDGYFADLLVDGPEQVSIDGILIALKNYANEMLSTRLTPLVNDETWIESINQQNIVEVNADQGIEMLEQVEPLEEVNKDTSLQLAKIEEYRQSLENIEHLAPKDISIQYIMNYKIREQFLQYLKNAEKSLYIISPWMNNYVINSEFKNDLENLLKRGVKVRIICGIADFTSGNQDYRDKNTQKIANELIRIAEPYDDLFGLKFGQTHEKLLICDDVHYINGSFNFLSYSGGEDKYFRNEGSTYCQDETLIQETIKLRFDF